MLELGYLIVGAFLLGSIPFAYLLVRMLFRVDVRAHGSGNPGATNASRVFPKRWRLGGFLLIFALDAGKGYAACALLPAWFERTHGSQADWVPAACGLAAVLGHSFSPFLKFRGGKGVATTLGVLIALEPIATLLALAVFGVIWAATRIVSLGSIAMAVVLPVAIYWRGEAPPAVGLMAILLGVLIIVRHRSNIGRLIRGTET